MGKDAIPTFVIFYGTIIRRISFVCFLCVCLISYTKCAQSIHSKPHRVQSQYLKIEAYTLLMREAHSIIITTTQLYPNKLFMGVLLPCMDCVVGFIAPSPLYPSYTDKTLRWRYGTFWPTHRLYIAICGRPQVVGRSPVL